MVDSIYLGRDVTTSSISSPFQWLYNVTALTIGDSVTSICDKAFSGFSNLTEVMIPDKIISIGNSAFMNCRSLSKLLLGNSVTSIGATAFYGCSSLAELTIPSSVTEIGDRAFEDCVGLSELNISNGVSEIGYRTFQGCSGLTKLTLPNSIISIGYLAFANCSSLFELTIPNSVTSIGESAFRECVRLTKLDIPDNVTLIGSLAFYDCANLIDLTIGNSMTSIGNKAFYNCKNIQNIYSKSLTPPEITSEIFNKEIENTAILHVPTGCKSIYSSSPYWANIVNIVEGVTSIINITEAEYTACVTEFDVDFTQTEGLAAYKVTSASASYATLEEIDFAPIGTAVILNGKAGTYTLYEAENEVDEIVDNIFMAGGNQVGDGSTIYALGNKANGVGFYLVAEGVAVPADKGYLVIHSTSEAKAFIPFGSGEATGIDTIAKEPTETNAIYNLAGQRITEPTQSGIYIVNGKKVFINK